MFFCFSICFSFHNCVDFIFNPAAKLQIAIFSINYSISVNAIMIHPVPGFVSRTIKIALARCTASR